MDLNILLTILTIVATGGGILVAINTWMMKQVRVIAKEEIVDAQNSCGLSRKETLIKYDEIVNKYEERMAQLEHSDNDTKLALLTIQKDLESLSNHHERTQSILVQIQDHQQATFSQLVETIEKISIK